MSLRYLEKSYRKVFRNEEHLPIIRLRTRHMTSKYPSLKASLGADVKMPLGLSVSLKITERSLSHSGSSRRGGSRLCSWYAAKSFIVWSVCSWKPQLKGGRKAGVVGLGTNLHVNSKPKLATSQRALRIDTNDGKEQAPISATQLSGTMGIK